MMMMMTVMVMRMTMMTIIRMTMMMMMRMVMMMAMMLRIAVRDKKRLGGTNSHSSSSRRRMVTVSRTEAGCSIVALMPSLSLHIAEHC